MDLVLIPGFWLDGSSWAAVIPALEAAGHTVHAVTLPGKEAPSAAREGIGLRDHIDTVAALIDSLDRPVVLVGHSGGGAIAHGVVDARPSSVQRAVYVDSGPLAEGGSINEELPAEGAEVPFPGWDAFEEADLRDMTPEIRSRFEQIAIPEPAGVARDRIHLADEARYDVPVTVICCEFGTDVLRELIGAGHPYVAELARCRSVDLVDLPTGHWPQFTRPDDLASAILDAVR